MARPQEVAGCAIAPAELPTSDWSRDGGGLQDAGARAPCAHFGPAHPMRPHRVRVTHALCKAFDLLDADNVDGEFEGESALVCIHIPLLSSFL